jgi:protein-(glutamine-N5) methyltransferase, release factor-specific
MLPDKNTDERLITERFSDKSERADALRRLADGEPVQYITGEAYFYGEVYSVSPDCLIPRPDTERLVDIVVRLYKNTQAKMLELCTGSGCIAISSAAHCTDLYVTAADISPGALAIAKRNSARNGTVGRVEFVCADITAEGFIASLPDGGFDVIVSNPPYIATSVIPTLDASVLREPPLALDGGADGLDFYRVILRDYKCKLAPSGVMLLEIGYDQADAIRELADENGYGCKVFRDYGGHDRVAQLKTI